MADVSETVEYAGRHPSQDADEAIRGAAPNWEQIPFDVRCGRCHGLLNGHSAPECPSCKLDLDWPTVVPVDELRCPACQYHVLGLREPRCPECGHDFQWANVLEIARVHSRSLLDRQWRYQAHRAVAKAMLWSIVRPWRMWSQYDIHATPALLPLVFLFCVQWVLFRWGWPAMSELATYGMNQASVALDTGLRFRYDLRVGRTFYPLMGWWYVCTLISFGVFFQSRRRYRVRWRHFARSFVHAAMLAACCPALWCLMEVGIDCLLLIDPDLAGFQRWGFNPYQVLDRCMWTVIVAGTWAFLWVALRSYVHMPRGWGIAAMCLGLGYLFANTILIMTA